MFEFQLKCHCLFLLYQQYPSTGSDNSLALTLSQAIIGTNDGLVYQHIYVPRLQWVKEQGHCLWNFMLVSHVIQCKSYLIAWNWPQTRNFMQCKSYTSAWNWPITRNCGYWWLGVFGTRALVATVLIIHPYTSSCFEQTLNCTITYCITWCHIGSHEVTLYHMVPY